MIPPNLEHHMWDTIRHPKFPNAGGFVSITNTQKRRLQKKLSEREKRDSQMVIESIQWPELKVKAVPNQPTPMIWIRESTMPKQKAKDA